MTIVFDTERVEKILASHGPLEENSPDQAACQVRVPLSEGRSVPFPTKIVIDALFIVTETCPRAIARGTRNSSLVVVCLLALVDDWR